MKWLRTKYIDTHYPDARSGEAHTRGLKRMLGIRSDGQLFETHGFADTATQNDLRAHLDTMLNDQPLTAGLCPVDTLKNKVGWVEEPEERKEICMDCGKELSERIIEYSFPYGVGENPAMIPVSHLGFFCDDCKLYVTDHRGEEARIEAINKHLAEKPQ